MTHIECYLLAGVALVWSTYLVNGARHCDQLAYFVNLSRFITRVGKLNTHVNLKSC